MTILHAPNHRNIKGTEYLEEAGRELRKDGLAVELELLQGRPNAEILEAVRASDVVADQFLMPGYAMAAVEAMASGRPVMDNMGGLPAELRATEAFERCPAVDATPTASRTSAGGLSRTPAYGTSSAGPGATSPSAFTDTTASPERGCRSSTTCGKAGRCRSRHPPSPTSTGT